MTVLDQERQRHMRRLLYTIPWLVWFRIQWNSTHTVVVCTPASSSNPTHGNPTRISAQSPCYHSRGRFWEIKESPWLLFRKEHEAKTYCPKCKASRFLEVDAGDGQPKRQLMIPVKIVRYLPFIQRIQRLYMIKETTKQMTWHKQGVRYNPDKMVHPSDGASLPLGTRQRFESLPSARPSTRQSNHVAGPWAAVLPSACR